MQLLQHFKELTVRPKNAEELKGLILQLAIQGKLTANWREKNPDVEPASELLKKIIKNKEVLIKSKIARKETAKKEFLREKVSFLIPETWISLNITEFYYTIGGKSNQIQSKNYNETGKYPIVSQGKNRIDGYSDNEGKLLKITKPIIVFGDHTRLVKYIDFNFIIGADGTKILNPFDGVDSEYFYLHTSFYNLSSKGYARHYSLLKLEAFALPPLLEQKEIVKVVETLFKEVELLEQLTVERINLKEDFVTSALNQLTTNNANQEWAFLQDHFKNFFNETRNIKKLRETVLQLAVQGKLTADWRANNLDTEDASVLLKRIQKEKAQLVKDKKIKDEKKISSITKDEIPYDLPESWVWCRMQDLCPNISSGSTPPKPFFKEEGVPYLKVYNIRNQNIDFDYRQQFVDTEYHSTKLKRSILRPGDVIMNIVGPPLGKVAIIPNGYPEWNCNQAISFFKPLKRELNTWIYTFLLAGTFLDRIELIGTAGQDNISVTKSKTIMLPLPPLEEQKAIVQKVNALMALCDTLEQEVQQSQEQIAQLMQSCLNEVFEPNNLN
jgi:type I restriction enzyme S subunit